MITHEANLNHYNTVRDIEDATKHGALEAVQRIVRAVVEQAGIDFTADELFDVVYPQVMKELASGVRQAIAEGERWADEVG